MLSRGRTQTSARHIQTTTPLLAARWLAPLWSEEEFGYNRVIRRAEKVLCVAALAASSVCDSALAAENPACPGRIDGYFEENP
jgi:hypothetical protein